MASFRDIVDLAESSPRLAREDKGNPVASFYPAATFPWQGIKVLYWHRDLLAHQRPSNVYGGVGPGYLEGRATGVDEAVVGSWSYEGGIVLPHAVSFSVDYKDTLALDHNY